MGIFGRSLPNNKFCSVSPHYWLVTNISKTVFVLWREEGYTEKYSLSQKEIPRVKPRGFPDRLGFSSLCIPTQVTIPTVSITIPVLSFQGEYYWKRGISVLLWQLELYFAVDSQLYWECTGKYTPSSTGSIFSNTFAVELDLYGKIKPSSFSNTEEMNFIILMFSNWEWIMLRDINEATNGPLRGPLSWEFIISLFNQKDFTLTSSK